MEAALDVGSSLAVVQATEASRNTALARQTVPEAQLSRAPFHCSPGRKGRVFAPQTTSTVHLVCAGQRAGHQSSERNRAPFPRLKERQEAPDTHRNRMQFQDDRAPEEKDMTE